MVTTFYPPRHQGGDAIYVQSLARGLVRAGHAVDVVCCDDAYRLAGGEPLSAAAPPQDAADGVRVHRIASPVLGRLASLWMHQAGGPGPLRAAMAAVLDRGYDVLHFHNVSLAGGPAVLGLGRADLRLLTLHDYWFVCPTHLLWKNGERACDRPTCLGCTLRARRPPQPWRWGEARERALSHVDAVLAPSAWSASEHRRRGFPLAIDVLPLFSRFPAAARRSTPPSRPRFLYAGRLTASKGVRLLVELFARLPQYDLVLVGDGELAAPLASAYATCPNLRFVGTLGAEDLASHYAAATATIMPSLAPESFGLVAVESFAFGTPVITLDPGASGDLVRESGAGIACRDAADLEAAIHRLASDPVSRDVLGGRALATCTDRFGEARHLDEYLALVGARLCRDTPAVVDRLEPFPT
jgi:glycosyltransferase involved in cell wall biosynthesis